MAQVLNLVGKTFGWLTVTSRAQSEKLNRLSYWNVLCTRCNQARFVVRSDELRNGRKTSCEDCRQEHRHHVVSQVIYGGGVQIKQG
jgi:hypothetical protein